MKKKKQSASKKSKQSSKSKSETSKRAHQNGHGKGAHGYRDESYDSDGSMLDLRENLRPIGAYMKDRERMLEEMFRCIRGAKLYAMLPDILKVIQSQLFFGTFYILHFCCLLFF